jgi:hypothetical protein
LRNSVQARSKFCCRADTLARRERQLRAQRDAMTLGVYALKPLRGDVIARSIAALSR